jgi:dTDP-glucose pyrophosphorylase
MNIVIPMAGAGSRFFNAGYDLPKPLIDVNGIPMIELVVNNIGIKGKYIFIVQKEHYEKYNLQSVLNPFSDDVEIVISEKVTEGAACTTLLAKKFIDNDEPLLIANSDQFIEWDNSVISKFIGSDYDAGLLTFKGDGNKWSYVRKHNDIVTEVAEKIQISNEASVGIYFWKRGADYVKYAEQMIEMDKRVNNEFYVCPVFNEAIQNNKKITTYEIEKMWGLGTPEDLSFYLDNFK